MFQRRTQKAHRSFIKSSLFLLGAALLLNFLPRGLQSEAGAQMFKGKTFVVMVASSPGGGTDTTARLIARSWAKYLPGNPDIIVRNKPLQVTAANQFHHRTRPNGLTVGVFAGGGALAPVARNDKAVRYDPLKWGYIGQIERGPSVLLVRKKVLANLTNPKADPVVAGSAGAGYRPQDAMAIYGAEYGGWNIKMVPGYPSSSDMYLAYERGEIDMLGSGTARIIKRFLKGGETVALLLHSPRGDFPDIPTFEQFLGDKRPKGLAARAYSAFSASSSVDKFFVLPPGTPENIVKVLSESFQKVVRDPEFVSRAQKLLGKGFIAMTGSKTKQMVRDALVIPKDVIGSIVQIRKKYGLPIISQEAR